MNDSENTNIVKYGEWTDEQIEKESKELATNSDFWKPPTGRTAVRFLPPKLGWPSPFVIQHQHFVRLPNSDKPIVFCCPRLHAKQACAACSKADQLEATGNARDAAVAKNLRPQKRVLANILIAPNDPEATPVVYGFGNTVYNSLKAIKEDGENGGNFLDPMKGFNIVIKRVGSTKDDTRYTVMPSRQESALPNMQVIEIQQDLRRMVRLPTPDQQKRLLAGENPKDVWGDGGGDEPVRAQAAKPSSSSKTKAAPKKAPIDVTATETAEDDLFDDEVDVD